MSSIESAVRKLVQLENKVAMLELNWENKCNNCTITTQDYETYSSRKNNLNAKMLETKREISSFTAS